MKFKHYRQLEKKDCGPTCLRMICKYYGKELSITQIRDLCETSKLGTSIPDLQDACRKLGFKSFIAKSDINNLSLPNLPIILYWHPAHFIVLYAIHKTGKQTYYYIADPGYGKLKLSEDTFKKRWEKEGKGVMLALEPTNAFYKLPQLKDKQKNTFLQLWEMYKGYIKEHKNKISIAFTLTVVGMVCSWFVPFFLSKIVDSGIEEKNLPLIGWILLLQFVITFGNLLARAFSSILLMRTNFHIGTNILTGYLHKIIKLPVSVFDKKQNSDFIVKLNDISRIQNFLSEEGISLLLLVANVIVFSSLLLYFNLIIFTVVEVLIGLGIIWATFFLKKRKVLDYELTRLETENNLAIQEIISEMSEIKANNAQNTKVKQWGSLYREQTKTIISSLHLNYWQTTGTYFFSIISGLLSTAISAYLVIENHLTIGSMMSIAFIVAQITVPIEQLIYYIRGLQEVAISNERVQEIHKYKEENEERHKYFSILNKGIEIKNMSFKYLGVKSPWVLKDINLIIPKKSITAIVGMSGSGKTTLLKLLLGFYTPVEGDIYIDDVNFNRYDLEYFRNEIGVVMQNGHIFSGSVIENISISDINPDIEKIKNVCKIACLDDFIECLPQKYKTKIGKNGIELSGGQKQRILIARALYKDPQILILDEATSSLDANTEKSIVENLNIEMKNKTVIIIAHRFSTIKTADQIIVLDKGMIVETGNHSLLTKSKGEYFKLIKNQLDLN